MTTPFSPKVRQDLWTRVGGCCSNPSCNVVTIGPALGGTDPLRTGEAAHIHSPEENGPRYLRDMSFESCQSAYNGIWLCRTCHKKVDLKANESFYPAEMLQRWKTQAEERADSRAGRPLQSAIYDPERERKRAYDFIDRLNELSNQFFRTEYRSGRQLTSEAIRLIFQGSRGFHWRWNRDNPLWSHDDAIWRKQNDIINILDKLNTHIQKKRWSRFFDDEPNCNRFTESRRALLTDAETSYAEELKYLLKEYFQLADELRGYVEA